jgi:hypothetical protein
VLPDALPHHGIEGSIRRRVVVDPDLRLPVDAVAPLLVSFRHAWLSH